ncbi:MAG: hypothetical protein ACRDKE_03280, partial [Solirubrobacterales bacterium]
MNDLNSQLPDPAANTSRTAVDAAMQSLASSITAIPREAESSKRAARQHTRRAFTLAVASAVCAIAALIGVTQLIGGSGTGSAWAAADIALAQKTPLLLFKAPGWDLKSFGQSEKMNRSGGITFENSSMHDEVGLHWETRAHLASRRRQLSSHAVRLPAMPVDGHRAQVFRQHSEGGGPMFTGHNALWVSGKYLLILSHQYRGKPSKSEDERFAKLLTRVESVSTDELLKSLPKNYIVPSKLPAAANEILADVPLPAGFSAEPVLTNLQSSTHENLALRLITQAECGWVRDWVSARKHGDKSEMNRIANVVAPYRTWRFSGIVFGPGKGKSYIGDGYMEALKR